MLDTIAADYWRALYVATLALVVGYRLGVPIVNAFRFRLRVAEVVEETPGVVSLRITGRRLDRLERARRPVLPLALPRAAATGGRRIRSRSPPLPTAARSASPSRRSATTRAGSARSRVGTRVLAEGPFGVFTDDARRRDKVA